MWIELYSEYPFTKTLWVPGSINKTWHLKIKDDFVWIKSLDEFKRKYRNKKGRINWHYNTWADFLENFWNHLLSKYWTEIDPIEYLIYLYWDKKEWISYVEIHKRYCYMGNYQNVETFRRFLVNILWWKLRDWNDRTESSKKKSEKSKNTSWFTENNNNKALIAQENFNKALLLTLEWSKNEISNIWFDLIIYKSKWVKEKWKKIQWSKKEQNIYLVSIIIWRKESNAIDILRSINQISWHWAIAKGLNEEMKKKWLDIEMLKRWIDDPFLSKGDIRRIVEQK